MIKINVISKKDDEYKAFPPPNIILQTQNDEGACYIETIKHLHAEFWKMIGLIAQNYQKEDSNPLLIIFEAIIGFLDNNGLFDIPAQALSQITEDAPFPAFWEIMKSHVNSLAFDLLVQFTSFYMINPDNKELVLGTMISSFETLFQPGALLEFPCSITEFSNILVLLLHGYSDRDLYQNLIKQHFGNSDQIFALRLELSALDNIWTLISGFFNDTLSDKPNIVMIDDENWKLLSNFYPLVRVYSEHPYQDSFQDLVMQILIFSEKLIIGNINAEIIQTITCFPNLLEMLQSLTILLNTKYVLNIQSFYNLVLSIIQHLCTSFRNEIHLFSKIQILYENSIDILSILCDQPDMIQIFQKNNAMISFFIEYFQFLYNTKEPGDQPPDGEYSTEASSDEYTSDDEEASDDEEVSDDEEESDDEHTIEAINKTNKKVLKLFCKIIRYVNYVEPFLTIIPKDDNFSCKNQELILKLMILQKLIESNKSLNSIFISYTWTQIINTEQFINEVIFSDLEIPEPDEIIGQQFDLEEQKSILSNVHIKINSDIEYFYKGLQYIVSNLRAVSDNETIEDFKINLQDDNPESEDDLENDHSKNN